MTHWDELIIVIAIGVLVTVIGFGASRWRRADLNHIEEWGLAGRSFGTIVTWFLLGGDLYTAYTFVAVPGVVFALGAYGLFALPYTIIIYPLVFLTMPRLWQVSRNKGYVTGSDYVKDRFDSRFFALLIALTGLVATMPYIALQIFGIKVVLANIGISPEAALIIAFVVLALFTYVSGLRAPALIAVVKDGLIWLVVIVAVIYIPYKLGGFGSIFHKVEQVAAVAPKAKAQARRAPAVAVQRLQQHRARLGAGAVPVPALAHRRVQRQRPARDQAQRLLPSGVLLPARPDRPVRLHGDRRRHQAQQGIRQQQRHRRPVPEHVPELVHRRGLRGHRRRRAGARRGDVDRRGQPVQPQHLARVRAPGDEPAGGGHGQQGGVPAGQGRRAGVRPGAADHRHHQLPDRGGVWMINALPALVVALYVKRLHLWAMVLGWAGGMGLGTYALFQEKFATSLHDFGFGGKIYIGFAAIAVNLVIVALGSLVAALVGCPPQQPRRRRLPGAAR